MGYFNYGSPYSFDSGMDDQSPYGNPYGFARMKNVFQQPETPEDTQKRFLTGITPFRPGAIPGALSQSPQSPQSSDDNGNYYNELLKLSAKGPQRTAYENAVAAPPQRSDPQFQQSNWRKLAQGLAAGAITYGSKNVGTGLGALQDMRDRPYNNAASEYDRKVRNLGASANMEQDDQKMQLSNLSQARALGLNYDKFKLDQAEFGLKQQKEQKDQAIAQQRADAYVKNQGKKEYLYTPQADGTLLATNKSDPMDKFIVPANTVDAANAKSRKSEVGISQQNANTNKQNADSLTTYRDRMGKKVSKDSATQQAAAMGNTLKVMVADPRFKDMITTDSTGAYEMPKDDGSLKYKLFKQEFQKRVKDVNPFGNDDDLNIIFNGVRDAE